MMLGLKWFASVAFSSEVVLVLGQIGSGSVMELALVWCLDFGCSLLLI